MPKAYHFVDARRVSETNDWFSKTTRFAGDFVGEGPQAGPVVTRQRVVGLVVGGSGGRDVPWMQRLDPLEYCRPARTPTTQMLIGDCPAHLICWCPLPATEAREY